MYYDEYPLCVDTTSQDARDQPLGLLHLISPGFSKLNLCLPTMASWLGGQVGHSPRVSSKAHVSCRVRRFLLTPPGPGSRMMLAKASLQNGRKFQFHP